MNSNDKKIKFKLPQIEVTGQRKTLNESEKELINMITKIIVADTFRQAGTYNSNNILDDN